MSSLRIGSLELNSPVVLAPMAGITNVAFRTLCRELELERSGSTSGLYVCEMVTARALVERHPVTMHMTTFGPTETPRSLQLYTVDPDVTYQAAKMIVDENLADHIDMNFGCPVPKVTRKGGGSALPYKRRLFGNIVAAAVRATEGTDIPVTVKFRIGIDADHHTHLDAGRIAAGEGAAAVALHARTAAQRYSGEADWNEIARLKEHVTDVPVLGNGDIFAAEDAQKMMERLDVEERSVQKSFEEDSSSVREQILALKDEREAVAGQISDDVMARYEAARKRFGGLAVETLVGNVPTTCRVKLQPSQYHDIAHGAEICECPYCHRILITTQDGE